MRSIGLDIGDYSVKIVELVQSKKSLHINQIQEKQLSQNVSKEDKELEVIEFVRSFLASGDYSQARWIMAIPQDQVTTRLKSFPFSDRVKIQKSLSFEMEDDIPFDTDACVFESKVIQTQGPSADILATAVPKSNIENLTSLASNFGVEIFAVSVEGLAFANLIEDWENPPPASATPVTIDESAKPKRYLQVVLNIGHKKTLFTAFENNRLVFTRSLYWGSQQLVQEIVRKYTVSYVEAVRALQTQAAVLLTSEGASKDQIVMSDLMAKTLKELSRDVQMTLFELQSELNAEITAVHFTGGASQLPNIGAFLTQQLEVACNPILLLQNYSGAISGNPQMDPRFTTAVAIALEGFKKPRNPAINLLKGDFAKQNDTFKILWNRYGDLARIGAAALVVLFVWTSLRGTFSTTLNEKGTDAVKEQARKVARLPKKEATENGLKKYIKNNRKRITELKLVSQVAKMNSALDVLKKVSESAPKKDSARMDIVSFIVKDELVQIQGYANSPQELSNLTRTLKTVAIDGQVNSETARLAPVANKTAFNISFKADRGVVK
jgi:general secretion pathway protein L